MKNFTPTQEQKIRALLRDCGQQAEQFASQKFQIYTKGPDDFVTSVDRLLDRQLTAGFADLFPEDGTITEENESSRLAFHAGYDRLWCIDPLDGTDDFIQGKPDYSVMVGLLCGRQPVAGWLYAPVQNQLYYGGRDWGLFQTQADEPSTVLVPVQPISPSRSFCPVMLGYKDQQNFGSAIAEVIPGAQFYSIGSFGLKVIEVIMGRVGLYLYLNGRVKLWDTVGPLALALAAGLTCCDLDGKPLSFENDAINPVTLAHEQSIVIGWPEYVAELRPKIQPAIANMRS